MVIRHAVVYFARAFHAFSAGIKCPHCMVSSVLLWLLYIIRSKYIYRLLLPDGNVFQSTYCVDGTTAGKVREEDMERKQKETHLDNIICSNITIVFQSMNI